MRMRNPLRRRWVVQKFKPWSGDGTILRNVGPPIDEQPPAPAQRLFWTLENAKANAERLNGGMRSAQRRERFRVVVRP
jgi:hypothetical protein